MYTKSYSVYEKYIHGLNTTILEQIIHVCLPHRGLSNKLTKGLAGLDGESNAKWV